jgi:hypothetical protein
MVVRQVVGKRVVVVRTYGEDVTRESPPSESFTKEHATFVVPR